ncbi:MAG: S8 family serine peptidase [Pseudomonadota bacterium]
MSKKKQTDPNEVPGAVPVRVTVHDVHGRPLVAAAKVELRAHDRTYALDQVGASAAYEVHAPEGTYTLHVACAAGLSPARSLEVGAAGATASAYVGDPDWPFYRLGQNTVPFEPPGDLLAVCFPAGQPDAKKADRICSKILKTLPLDPAPLDGQSGEEDQPAFIQAQGAVWTFRCTDDDTDAARAELHHAIRKITGDQARIGVPTDLTPGSCKVIDNRFVVRFREGVERAQVDKLVAEAGGTILRGFRQARNGWLIELPPGDYRQHLAIIEQWYQDDLLVYGEPDIMAEITDDAFPQDAPDDPTYATQANLTLQNVDIAWQILNSADPDHTLGRPQIYIASLDRGLDTDHPDIGGNLTDGTNQVARCYDFSGLRECTVAGYTPDTDHGMGVYGIIAARTDNNTGVAGIASNTHQIVMERPSLTDANYPDVLLWAAGFSTGNSSSGWPAEPLPNGADIISCSHGSNGLALSGIMDDTFQDLANNGRGGLGTVVVYSAGNDNTLITGFRTWAAHPDTIAVANSLQPDGTGVERKAGTSNFGPEIDVCAQGAGAPSLDASGGEQSFGGTSAAAPTVAAVAGLMLSNDDSLSRAAVRDRLRNTAVQIDAANTDPVGQWIGGFSQWYGFGRINAASAVCGVDPTVTLDSLSINFNDVPEGETTVRAADFTVQSCEPVTLTIVAGPSGPFSTPLGITETLGFSADLGPRPAKLWLAYTATNDGDTANGSVTIEWVETGQQWTIPISANTVTRPTVAVELVLDQSQSMGWASGLSDLPKRVDVLKASVPPLLEVIQEDNAIGIVSFDHDAYDVMPVTVAGVPVFGAGRAAAKIAVEGHTPNPAGATAIGDGVQQAQGALAPQTSYDVRAMIVFTDGHETAADYIADVDHMIDDRVYAIGLGTADVIQPTALTALTNGTGGYLLLTGDLAGDDYFLLAKYYLQILAGVTNEDIVLDPQGFLGARQQHCIPFNLTETDITSDVILLTPAPEVICFSLLTPDGELLTPSVASALPGTEYISGQNTSYYRMSLPVPLGAGAAAGQWRAVLEIDDRAYKRYLSRLEKENFALYEQTLQHGIRYSLNVHSYSNLRMRASLAQTGYEAGAEMSVQAVLTEYGLPVEQRASVHAEITRPDGTQVSLPLVEEEPGVFRTSTTATANGVYRFLLRAKGNTLRQRPFTREQIVTGAAWHGGNHPPPTGRDEPDGATERWCRFLECLLKQVESSPKAKAWLERCGLEPKQLQRCLEVLCDPRQTPVASSSPFLRAAPSLESVAMLRQLVDALED